MRSGDRRARSSLRNPSGKYLSTFLISPMVDYSSVVASPVAAQLVGKLENELNFVKPGLV